MYQIIAYIQFLFRSTNQHGVHSPFVYNFVTKCLYDKTKYPEYDKLKTYRNALKNSTKLLEITDFGEGSKTLNPNKRKVSAMVKASSSSPKKTRLLFRVSKYFELKSILELGTSLGMGTYAFAVADQTSKITTIEGCPNTSNFTKSKFEKLKVENVEFLRGDFTTIIPTLKQEKFDCIFFDGHHNKAATISYFESLLPKIHNETVFIFDDIYWSKGMTEAWDYIKSHSAVSVTIDTFNLGFVFFRKEQAKEHFTLRV